VTTSSSESLEDSNSIKVVLGVEIGFPRAREQWHGYVSYGEKEKNPISSGEEGIFFRVEGHKPVLSQQR
jgi:hypothetical protein